MSSKNQGVSASLQAGSFTTEVRARGHRIISDEPGGAGGADRGMSPVEMLYASLCACTVITMEMYARRKGWPMESCRASASGFRERPGPGALDRIDMTIELTGPLTDEQRTRIIEIAHKCPVHRTLAAGVAIHISH